MDNRGAISLEFFWKKLLKPVKAKKAWGVLRELVNSTKTPSGIRYCTNPKLPGAADKLFYALLIKPPAPTIDSIREVFEKLVQYNIDLDKCSAIESVLFNQGGWDYYGQGEFWFWELIYDMTTKGATIGRVKEDFPVLLNEFKRSWVKMSDDEKKEYKVQAILQKLNDEGISMLPDLPDDYIAKPAEFRSD